MSESEDAIQSEVASELTVGNHADAEWYIYESQAKHGPYTHHDLQTLIHAGRFSDTAVTWREGFETWLPIGQIFPFAPPIIPSVIKASRSSPSKFSKWSILSLVAASGFIIAFLLPWAQVFGVAVSGYNLSQLGSYGNLAWLLPLAGFVVGIMLFLGSDNRFIRTTAGFLPWAALLYCLGLDNDGTFFHVISIGPYVALLAGGVLILSPGLSGHVLPGISEPLGKIAANYFLLWAAFVLGFVMDIALYFVPYHRVLNDVGMTDGYSMLSEANFLSRQGNFAAYAKIWAFFAVSCLIVLVSLTHPKKWFFAAAAAYIVIIIAYQRITLAINGGTPNYHPYPLGVVAFWTSIALTMSGFLIPFLGRSNHRTSVDTTKATRGAH